MKTIKKYPTKTLLTHSITLYQFLIRNSAPNQYLRISGIKEVLVCRMCTLPPACGAVQRMRTQRGPWEWQAAGYKLWCQKLPHLQAEPSGQKHWLVVNDSKAESFYTSRMELAIVTHDVGLGKQASEATVLHFPNHLDPKICIQMKGMSSCEAAGRAWPWQHRGGTDPTGEGHSPQQNCPHLRHQPQVQEFPSHPHFWPTG